jgi:hypothetical protein
VIAPGAGSSSDRRRSERRSLIISVEPPLGLSSPPHGAPPTASPPSAVPACFTYRALMLTPTRVTATNLVLAKPNVIMNHIRLRGWRLQDVRLPVGRTATTTPRPLATLYAPFKMRLLKPG